MSTSPHQRRDRRHGSTAEPSGIRIAPTLFARANPFVDAAWQAADLGLCMSAGCTDCGALGFRRALMRIDGIADDVAVNAPRREAPAAAGALARAVAELDFDLLRLAPRWYDALDVALMHLRERRELRFVLDDWVARPAIPARILDLVLYRHVRYGYPDERLADLWIERCLRATAEQLDDGLVESLILACPERVGADPAARRAAFDAAARSSCVRDVIGRLGECG
jgi:hypothetical protein